MNNAKITNLYCALQDRLGALDRLLGALTHRGIVPQQIVSSRSEDARVLEVSLTFHIDDDKALQKLVKSLQKQIYVLDVRLLGKEPALQAIPVKIRSLFTPYITTEQRRISHVHNA